MVHALSSLAEYAALRGVSITLEDFDGFTAVCTHISAALVYGARAGAAVYA